MARRMATNGSRLRNKRVRNIEPGIHAIIFRLALIAGCPKRARLPGRTRLKNSRHEVIGTFFFFCDRVWQDRCPEFLRLLPLWLFVESRGRYVRFPVPGEKLLRPLESLARRFAEATAKTSPANLA